MLEKAEKFFLEKNILKGIESSILNNKNYTVYSTNKIFNVANQYACYSHIRNKKEKYFLFSVHIKNLNLFKTIVKHINYITPCKDYVTSTISADNTKCVVIVKFKMLNDYIKDLILLNFLRDLTNEENKNYFNAITTDFKIDDNQYKGMLFLTKRLQLAVNYMGEDAKNTQYYEFSHNNFCGNPRLITTKEFLEANLTNQQYLKNNAKN